MYKLLLLLLVPVYCCSQSQVQNEKLITLTRNLIDVYNANDSVGSAKFIQGTAKDEARIQAFHHQFAQEHAHIGPVKVHRIKTVSPTEAEALVQSLRYEAWWRVVVITDSSQQFKEHHMGLVRVTDEVLQTGALSDTQLKTEIEDFLRRQMAYQSFCGNILIRSKNKTLYARSFGNNATGQPNTFKQPFGMASVSKLFTAVAILQLVDKKALGLETKVATVLPELKNKKLAHITVQQLLSHTAGMGDYFEDPQFTRIVDSVNATLTSMISTNLSRLASFLPFIERDSLQFEPGKGWRYSNTGFELLGLIVERISGIAFNRYITDSVFRKAGMKHAAAGTGSGGSVATVSDLYAFSQALQEEKLLSKQLTGQLLHYTINGSYGYGTEHQTLGGENIVGHSGGFEKVCTELNMYEHAGITVIILSNIDPPLGHFLSDKIKQLLIRKPRLPQPERSQKN
ncbi:MAG: beta-lactamase family protein [Williamsia sp.]|nr:beta-lactamase family protein [Williamsia sp.]